MKKFLALAALVLGMVSCQQDYAGLDVDVNGEAAVTVSVAIPEMETRAGGEDSAVGAFGNINLAEYDVRYILEVYDHNGALAKERLTNYEDEGMATAFNLRLIPGRAYRFVVWADFVLEDSKDDLHYDTENLREIEVIPTNFALSDESRDAYTGVQVVAEFSNSAPIAIELKRPLGKLRVVTTDVKDMYNLLPEDVTVVYTSPIYTVFNAYESDVVSTETIAHGINVKISESKYAGEWNTEGKVKEGLTLFTDYFFAAKEQEPINFTLDVKDNSGLPIPQVVFSTPIPIQRNYLTTVTGPILTDSGNITVKIEDAFAGEKECTVVDTTEALAAAVAAAKDGDTILIDGEVTMPYFTNKALNFFGISEKAIVKQSPATHIDTFYSGATLNFKNVKLVGEAYKNNTQGYQNSVKESYENCHFVDYIMFAGETTTIKDCTFENKAQYFWTGTAKNITFENCVFNGLERAVKVCTVGNIIDTKRVATFKNCEFTATNKVKSAIEIDGSQGHSYIVNINGCTATGFKVSDYTGESLFNISAGAENVTIKIDGNTWVGKGVIKDENDNYVVNSLTTLETALEAAGAAGAGDTTIVFAENAQLNMTGAEWTPIKVDGYHGADIVTIEGNGAVITGLNAPLFAGGFAGGSGIVIKNLTIKDSNIVSANTIGSGAFIESVDSMAKIELTNCHLLNSTVTGGAGSRTGGLLGWTAGYSNQNDGPVKTYVTIDGCSVIGCTITCDGSVGGINGHAGNNDWTYTTIKNCTIKDNTLASTDDGAWRVGVVVGTANVGEVTISNITESGNTLTQTGKTAPEGFKRNYYGRAVLGTTGKLTIDGYKYVAEGQFEDANGNAVVGNQTALAAVLAAGKTNVTLTAGNYELSGLNFVANNVTLKGADKANVVLNLEKSIYLQNKSVTLENLTYNLNAGKNYTEQAFAFVHHATAFNLKNCNVNRLRLNVYEANIEGCTFTLNTSSGFDGYCIYYYGNDNSTVNVKNSTFATAGKGICIYSEHAKAYNLNVNECTFTSSNASTDKAAIQMHAEYGIYGNVKITETTATGFANINGGLWNELNNQTGTPTDKFDIWVDGTQVH